MEAETNETKIDVRIIVSGLDVAQLVSKAVNNIQLERDYNIIVSSIIPTTELNMVKKVAIGADILLIGGYGHDETYNVLFNELKTDFNHIGLFNYTNIIIEDESIDFKLAEKELLNSIINSTLSYSLNLINIHSLENKLMSVTRNYNNLLDDYNQLIKENEVLSQENKELREDLNEIKADFDAFKVRYEDVYSKDILEVFNLDDLWQDVFHQELNDEERIVMASNKFRPDNIIIGQGYIAAESKSKAIEWLNIVRTALIFVDDDIDDLKKEVAVDEEIDSSEDNEDYDLTNTFENFWD